MKNSHLLGGLLIGFAIIAASYIWFQQEGAAVDQKLSVTHGIKDPSQKAEILRSAKKGSSIDHSEPKKGVTLFSHLPQSRHGLPLDSDPFVAASVEEQMWLDRNGYPNAEQWVAYSSASDGLLAQAAADGDTFAAVILDSRALANGDKGAVNRLLKESQNGSTFALSMLQAYMANSPKGNPSLAYSLSRVLELKGDTRAGLARDFSSGVANLSPAQRVKAEANALKLFEQLKETSKKQPFVDKRPFPQST